MTLNSCAKTTPTIKIINADTFCTGKYTPLGFSSSQYDRIEKARAGEYGDIFDTYIKNHALNGREFKQCPK